MAARTLRTALFGFALVSGSQAIASDEVGLVQKALSVTEVVSNASKLERAWDMRAKLSGIIRMIDNHQKSKNGNIYQQVYDCFRNVGATGLDSVLQFINDVKRADDKCGITGGARDASARRDCAIEVVRSLQQFVRIGALIPSWPQQCLVQDCAPNDGQITVMLPETMKAMEKEAEANKKSSKGVALFSGLERIMQAMTAIGQVDRHCISQDSYELGLKHGFTVGVKPFFLLNNIYDNAVLAFEKSNDLYHYSVCQRTFGFFTAINGMLSAIYEDKASEDAEKGNPRNLHLSSKWACASALTKLVDIIPGTMGAACEYSACQNEENLALAKREYGDSWAALAEWIQGVQDKRAAKKEEAAAKKAEEEKEKAEAAQKAAAAPAAAAAPSQ